MEKLEISWLTLFYCVLFAACLWICTFTVFLPLFLALLMSGTLRAKFFAFIFPTFFIPSKKTSPTQLPSTREKLFTLLKEHVDSDTVRKPLCVLEIGVGEAANIQYYPDSWSLTFLDANPNFEPLIREKLKNFSNLNVENIVIAQAEDMKGVKDNSFDIVVSTHFLCSVTDVNLIFKEVHRVLKTGGKYAFLDHVAHKEHLLVYWVQKLCTPLWKVYMDGCCLDRDIIGTAKQHFRNVSSFMQYSDAPVLLNAISVSIATK